MSLNVYCLPNNQSYNIAESLTNSVIYIDEVDMVLDKTLLLSHTLIQNNNYLVLVSRDDLDTQVYVYDDTFKFFELAVDSVCKLVDLDGITVLQPLFDFNRLNILKSFNNILVEDEKAGFEFYKLFTENVTISKGNSNVCNFKELLQGNTLVIVDVANFGKFANKFNNKFFKKNPNLSIIPKYECFEEMLLRTNIFRYDSVVQHLFDDLSVCNVKINWEKVFEQVVEERAPDTLLDGYKHGNDLPFCFYNDCNNTKCHIKRFENCLRSPKVRKDKLKELFKETKYEFLYNLLSKDVNVIPDGFEKWCAEFAPAVYADYSLEEKWNELKDIYNK